MGLYRENSENGFVFSSLDSVSSADPASFLPNAHLCFFLTSNTPPFLGEYHPRLQVLALPDSLVGGVGFSAACSLHVFLRALSAHLHHETESPGGNRETPGTEKSCSGCPQIISAKGQNLSFKNWKN